MRLASYQISPAAGDGPGTELAVFYFGVDQGGSVDANIGRWVGQFKDIDAKKDVKRSERDANDLKQYIVEIEKGTFDSGMPMAGPKGPQQDWAMLGSIIESPLGKYFFKLTGPAKTVAANKNAFFTLLDSVKVETPSGADSAGASGGAGSGGAAAASAAGSAAGSASTTPGAGGASGSSAGAAAHAK
jgi:hypothetical protein